jgi:hypothetical protein
MGYFKGVRDLRNLLNVARKLRKLASEPVAPEDRELYLTAAAALEARAGWMANTLPEDRRSQRQPPRMSRQPVDLLV